MTAKAATTPVLTRLRHFCSDRRGVAAVEFAVVLPFMLALYVGGVELGDGMAIQVKVTDTAHTVADLVTQNKNISNAMMQTILNSSQQIIAPYSQLNVIVTISEVSIDASGAATVTWSESLNGTPRAVGQTMTLPSSLAGQASVAGQPKISLIFGEVSYAYTPNLGYTITGTVNLTDSYWLFPRNSICVTRTASPSSPTCPLA
jgi:Flp pilus assembly protein TadG